MPESFYGVNLPSAYSEGLHKMRVWGVEEDSRNGPVITCPEPVFMTILNPKQRVLFDQVRDANPFFHLMETAWMFAGRDDLAFIQQFNKRFAEYADPGAMHLHAAYGYRWIHHFEVHQISRVISMLRNDRTTRRAVIGMWDPRVDLYDHNDLPCNTQIMFRYDKQNEELNMTVINRSNDYVWGMMGANAVHMTFLHELIASACGMTTGTYSVFTNNLHIYKNMPKFDEIWDTLAPVHGAYLDFEPHNLLLDGEHWQDLLLDCCHICANKRDGFRTAFAQHLLYPVREAYYERLNGGDGLEWTTKIANPDWKMACQMWINRRLK